MRELIRFDFEIQYKPGSTNKMADALSRKGKGELEFGWLELEALITSQGVDWGKLELEAGKDVGLRKKR